MHRQKVAEVEKLSQTVRELEEAVLAGGAAANAVRDYQRKVQEMNVLHLSYMLYTLKNKVWNLISMMSYMRLILFTDSPTVLYILTLCRKREKHLIGN